MIFQRLKLLIGGNVTLHPEVALQRCDDLKSVAASLRNAAHC